MEVVRVGSTVRFEAPAKLNLFLEVLGKRADGFHEIETLMMAISIYDTFVVTENVVTENVVTENVVTENVVTENSEGRIRLECSWAAGMAARHKEQPVDALGDLPSPADNIVVRAAERLRREAGTAAGATIRIIKRIPSAAGLGGASSDAAAVILALNHIWKLGWPADRLAGVAAAIGSDVPFFVTDVKRGLPAAMCRGRGERIEPVSSLPSLNVVVVRPPAGLGTAAVYRDCSAASQPRNVTELLDALRRGETGKVGRLMFNRLQDTAERLCPWVGQLRRRFEQTDVLGHQMSGSGTSYFGVCRHRRHAQHVAAQLRSNGIGEVFCASTLSGW